MVGIQAGTVSGRSRSVGSDAGADRTNRGRTSGQTDLAFKRSGGRWWMAAPESGLANPILLNPIMDLAEAHCPLRYAVAELDLKALQARSASVCGYG